MENWKLNVKRMDNKKSWGVRMRYQLNQRLVFAPKTDLSIRAEWKMITDSISPNYHVMESGDEKGGVFPCLQWTNKNIAKGIMDPKH